MVSQSAKTLTLVLYWRNVISQIADNDLIAKVYITVMVWSEFMYTPRCLNIRMRSAGEYVAGSLISNRQGVFYRAYSGLFRLISSLLNP